MAFATFENIQIKYNDYVYKPAEDSFLLAKAALETCKSKSSILEIGTGSGFISVIILKSLNVSLLATDISPYAVECAYNNDVPVIQANLFSAFKLNTKFDTIIFNPPYLPTSLEEKIPGWLNYAFDGGNDGTIVIESFIINAIHYLHPYGQILLLISSLTGINKIMTLMHKLNFDVKIIKKEKCDFEELVVLQGVLKK